MQRILCEINLLPAVTVLSPKQSTLQIIVFLKNEKDNKRITGCESVTVTPVFGYFLKRIVLKLCI